MEAVWGWGRAESVNVSKVEVCRPGDVIDVRLDIQTLYILFYRLFI